MEPVSRLVSPWLYHSPKIHKHGKPLCLIMDYTVSLAFAMFKPIADLLNPLIGKTSYHIKNTVTFSKELKDL